MAMPAFPPGLNLCFFGGIGAGVGVVLEVLVVGPVCGFDTSSCAFVVSGGCVADSDIAAAGAVCTVDATSAAGVAAATSTASSEDCTAANDSCAILRAEKGFRCKINSEVCCKVYSRGPQGNKMKH